MDEIRRAKNVILFIDEMHTLVGAGAAEGAMDASNILKPALARGELQCVGATTLNEYRKHIEKDAALERRFQPVKVEPPSTSRTPSHILRGHPRASTRSTTSATSPTTPLEAAAELSDRYITGRFLPDKAIDVIDEAGARARIRSLSIPADIDVVQTADRARSAARRKTRSRNQKFEEAANLRDSEKQLRAKREKIARGVAQEARREARSSSARTRCIHIVADWTGVPLNRLEKKETQETPRTRGRTCRRPSSARTRAVVGRAALRRSRADLKDPRRPIGSFLFLGPTGVGKTDSWPRRWPSSCSATKDAVDPASTCPSTWRSSPSPA
jgi:ATP-dependent Clp protease ATP-binding subunit ClpC